MREKTPPRNPPPFPSPQAHLCLSVWCSLQALPSKRHRQRKNASRLVHPCHVARSPKPCACADPQTQSPEPVRASFDAVTNFWRVTHCWISQGDLRAERRAPGSCLCWALRWVWRAGRFPTAESPHLPRGSLQVQMLSYRVAQMRGYCAVLTVLWLFAADWPTSESAPCKARLNVVEKVKSVYSAHVCFPRPALEPAQGGSLVMSLLAFIHTRQWSLAPRIVHRG